MDIFKSMAKMGDAPRKPKIKTKTNRTRFSLRNMLKRKGRTTRKSKSQSRSRSSSAYSNLSGSLETKKKKLSRNILRKYRSLGVDQKSVALLDQNIAELDTMAKQTFGKKSKTVRRSSKTPSSPIMLTIKNLDTGKKQDATVVKNLNTGKYEFVEV